MLPTIDNDYLANQVSNFKKTYFQHVMDYGPTQHVNFMLPFSEIKQATDELESPTILFLYTKVI